MEFASLVNNASLRCKSTLEMFSFLLKARDLQIKMKLIFFPNYTLHCIFLLSKWIALPTFQEPAFQGAAQICPHLSARQARHHEPCLNPCQAAASIQLPQVPFERVASGSHWNQPWSQGDDFQLPCFVALFKWISGR